MNAQVWLVARREIGERIRSKVYLIGTLFTVVAIVGGIVAANSGDDDSRPRLDVALTAQAPAGLWRDLAELGNLIGARVNVREAPIATDEIAPQLRGGDVDVVATADEVLVRRTPTSEATSALDQLALAVAQRLGQRRAFESAGIDESTATRILTQPPGAVRAIEPPDDEPGTGRSTAIVGSVLTFLFIVLYANWVLTGVVEEKTSRVAEVLFATLPPRRLMLGKVIGIGAVALTQALVVALAAVLAGSAVGAGLLAGASGGAIASALVWFILGYLLYAAMFAAAGALAGRSEDAQSLSFPIQVPLIAAYIVAIGQATRGEDAAILRVLSMIPFTAPVAMPVRIGLASAAVWEIVVSAVLAIVTVAIVLRFAEKVYRRGMLHTGGRLKLRAAVST